MLLFFRDYGGNRAGCRGVARRKSRYLVLEMAEHHTLDSDGGSSDRARTEQARDQAKYQPTDTAQPVAPTTRMSATLKLLGEDCTMSQLVRAKLR